MAVEKIQKNGIMSLFAKIFTLEFVLLLVWIPCVIFIFKIIEDRKVAGLVAGAGFLGLPIFNITREIKKTTSKMPKLSRVVVSAIFLLVSALPIFLYRVFNWDKNLEDISILGVLTGRQLHSYSNILFMAMILVYFITNILEAKNQNHK